MTPLQLTKLQSEKLSEREKFLTKEGFFKINRSVDNETKFLFGYELDYSVTSYERSSPREIIDFYESPGLPVFLVLKASSFCFNDLQKQFNSSSSISSNSSLYSARDFKQNKITFSFRNYFDSNKIQHVLVYNTAIIAAEIEDAQAMEEEKRHELQLKQDEFYRIVRIGDSLQSLSEFESAIQYYEDALLIVNDDIAKNRIQQCRMAECNSMKRKADESFELGNYLTAIEWYTKVKSCATNSAQIVKKIAECEERILKSRIQEIKNRADHYFDSKMFAKAKETYGQLLDMEPDNAHAKSRIKEINELQAFLLERKSKIFEYSEQNPEAFQRMRNELVGHLNQSMESNLKGELIYDFNISFDTSGQNLTSHYLARSTIANFDEFLKRSHNYQYLTPVINKGYYTAAKSKISISASWSTGKVVYLSKSRNSRFLSGAKNYQEIINFVGEQDVKKGKFTFDVKKKVVNDKILSDIYLVDFSTRSGPAYSLLSLLYPGIGSLKVSNGEVGWSRMVWFTVLGASAYYCRLTSVTNYNRYLNASSQSEMNSHYLKANLLHKSALVLGGCAATIYLTDFCWALKRGVKNEIAARGLKRSKKERRQVSSQNFY